MEGYTVKTREEILSDLEVEGDQRHKKERLQRFSRYWNENTGKPWNDDKSMVLAAVRVSGRALANASDDLKKDRDVVLAAVGQDPHAFEEIQGVVPSLNSALQFEMAKLLLPENPEFEVYFPAMVVAEYNKNKRKQKIEFNAGVRSTSPTSQRSFRSTVNEGALSRATQLGRRRRMRMSPPRMPPMSPPRIGPGIETGLEI